MVQPNDHKYKKEFNMLLRKTNDSSRMFWIHLREFCIDFFASFPYVISDSMLYFLNAVNFLDVMSRNNPEDNKWIKPQYIILEILMGMLAMAYFTTFSQSNAQLFGVENKSKWAKIKGYIRKITGIPGAILKTLIGSSSFFLSTRQSLGDIGAWIISNFIIVLSFPSLLSLLWSNFERASNSENTPMNASQIRDRTLSYIAIHLSAFSYSISNTSLYYWSILNFPARVGLMDHTVNQANGEVERAIAALSLIISAFPLMATYISYAHLNENMYGLTADESPKWTNFKRCTKKAAGGVAACAKVTNASVSVFSFFNKNIAATTVCGISGLITQFSLLYNDPLRNSRRSLILSSDEMKATAIASNSLNKQPTIQIAELNEHSQDQVIQSLTVDSKEQQQTATNQPEEGVSMVANKPRFSRCASCSIM